MPQKLEKLFLLNFIKIVVEHLFCRISTFLSFEYFLKMGFCDLFRCFFTTQIIPDLLFSIWQAYILPSRKII